MAAEDAVGCPMTSKPMATFLMTIPSQTSPRTFYTRTTVVLFVIQAFPFPFFDLLFYEEWRKLPILIVVRVCNNGAADRVPP